MSKPHVALEHAVILILASFGRDAQTLARIVEPVGAAPRICSSGLELCGAFNESTAAILITEEALVGAADKLHECVLAQPAWSDVPVIILSGGRGRAGAPARWQFFRQFGNVTVLSRPMSGEALRIALEAACRARAWQHVVRDQMQKLEVQNVDLEQKVRERTQALQNESGERKRIESALNEARRLEAIGRLSAGVAHDFNNLLQVISGAANLYPYVRDDSLRTEGLMKTILRATERGSKLTEHMLAFGRRQILSTGALDVARQIMEMKGLLQQALRERISLELRLQADLWHANADVTQLEIALLNLTMNAKDVLPSRGSVTLTACNVTLPTARIPDVPELNGDFVRLTFTDDGPGMPPDVAAKAFDPFFTTKRIGEGSGLGLSQVYGFAKQSGGTAWISAGNRGTSVSILLPRGRMEKAAGVEHNEHDVDGENRLRGLRVLYVEDDEAVGEVTISLLKAFGCRVDWVRTAEEALASDMRSYDLVFSDVQMPGSIDGIELAKGVAQRYPGIPVLLASGYVIAPERLDELHADFIAKPYDAGRLRRAMLNCLE
jgi:signal transduction histidine kinase